MKWLWKTLEPSVDGVEPEREYTPFPQADDLTRPSDRELVAYLIPYLYEFICEPPPQIIWASSPVDAIRLVALTAWCLTDAIKCGCTAEEKLQTRKHHYSNVTITPTLFPGLQIPPSCRQAPHRTRSGEQWVRRSAAWSLRQSITDELSTAEGLDRWHSAAQFLIDQQTCALKKQSIQSAIDSIWHRANDQQIELLSELVDWAADPRQSHSIDRETLGFCTQQYLQSVSLLRGLNAPLSDEFKCANELALRASFECTVFWPLYGITILSERPCEIDIAAYESVTQVKWTDGFSLYFANRVRISKAIAERNFTWQDIDKEANAEVRSVLIEFYGLEKYLRDSQAQEVQRDEYGILYRKDFAIGEPLFYVQVENKTAEQDGSFKTYFLQVPDFVESAREGVAWTFDIDDPEEYNPVVES